MSDKDISDETIWLRVSRKPARRGKHEGEHILVRIYNLIEKIGLYSLLINVT